jgi:hypothetical protein
MVKNIIKPLIIVYTIILMCQFPALGTMKKIYVAHWPIIFFMFQKQKDYLSKFNLSRQSFYFC